MQEQLVSKETAILAREKGYNFYSKYFHTDSFGLCYIDESGEFLYNTEGHHQYDCNGDFSFGERYYAPTQSLLQRWLREVHNIHISVGNIYNDWSKWSFAVVVKNKGIIISFRNDKNIFNSYEEALEIGLLKALKLIE